MMRNYLRTIAAVDENLGRLLDALDDLGLATNAIVVYSSDNGFYLGEHGLSDKRSAYDESMRIPLLLRYPPLGVKEKTLDAMVLNIDLAPTFLDYAGVRIPSTMQGRSWRSLLERGAGGASSTSPFPWRSAFFYEYFYERNFAIPTTLAVRTESAKLVKYPGHDDWTELFDLKADPYEQRNLFSEPESKALRERLLAEFERQAKAVDFAVPDDADPIPQDAAQR
jgi:arylsulfatase A-like enzyme